MEAIINSMTFTERGDHTIIDASRRRRIALGSGTTVADVNQLIKNFSETKKLLRQYNKGGLRNIRKLFS
jgi:signal recognition particle subunit SRP54